MMISRLYNRTKETNRKEATGNGNGAIPNDPRIITTQNIPIFILPKRLEDIHSQIKHSNSKTKGLSSFFRLYRFAKNTKKNWVSPGIELGTSCTLSKNHTTRPRDRVNQLQLKLSSYLNVLLQTVTMISVKTGLKLPLPNAGQVFPSH